MSADSKSEIRWYHGPEVRPKPKGLRRAFLFVFDKKEEVIP